MPADTTPSPAQLVSEIETEVARKKAAGEYPKALLRRLEAEFKVSVEQQDPEELAFLATARTLQPAGPLGGLVVFIKRVIRKSIAWYVRPIAEDQSHFNVAIIREVRRLQQRVDELEKKRRKG